MSEKILIDNTLFTKAIIFASSYHRNQVRKGSDTPYILHPLEVMQNLYLMGASKALMIAGLLHDTVEDTEATLEDINNTFGPEIMSLVASHTEMHKELPWHRRKEQALADCSKATKEEQMLVLADKLANIRSMSRDYQSCGETLWERFNKGFKDQAWYYHGGVRSLQQLENYPETATYYLEFKELVYNLFGEPEAYICEADLENQELVIAETKESYVTLNIEENCLTLHGDEFGSSDIGSDSYEYSIALDTENTHHLLLQIRKDFGQEITLKDIFKRQLCVDGRYFSFLRYCEKNNITFLMESF